MKRRLESDKGGGDGDGVVVKKKRASYGFTPFRQIEIPSNWKYESRKLQESVCASVANCHYDDPSKKQRLCAAVLEALSGQKTMKAAAISHGVPFTTLQTYFHRSRARMAKLMNEYDNGIPEQIRVPVSLNLSPQKIDDALASNSNNEVKAGRLDTVLGLLSAKLEEQIGGDEGCMPAKSPSPPVKRTGSNKRKPKRVHRVEQHTQQGQATVKNGDFIDDSALEAVQSDLYDCAQTNLTFPFQFTSGIPGLQTKDAVGKRGKQLKCEAVEREDNFFIEDSWNQNDLSNCFAKSLYATQAQPSRPIRHRAGKKVDKSLDRESCTVGPPLDPNDIDRIEKIENCINEVCKASLYPAAQKEMLCRAVGMVIRGELTINASANMMQLPSSTVHPYVHRARAALGTLLPPQASGPTVWNGVRRNYEPKENGSSMQGLYMKNSFGESDDLSKRNALTNNQSPSFDETTEHDIYAPSAYQSASAASPNDSDPSLDVVEAQHTNGSVGADANALATSSVQQMNNCTDSELSSTFDQTDDGGFESDIVHIVNKLIANCVRCDETPGDRSSSLQTKLEKQECVPEARNGSTKDVMGSESSKQRSGKEPSTSTFRLRGFHRIHKNQQNGAPFIEGMPRSIREVAKLLVDVKLENVTKNYMGTRDELADKVDMVLRTFKFKGDPKNMCDAILKVLFDSRTLMEVCSSNNLAPTTLSTYVRLVKALIKSEASENDAQQQQQQQQCSSSKSPKCDQDTRKAEPESAMKGIEKVDVMSLHTTIAVENPEMFVKLIVAYLIQQQYQSILLDGLSLAETLSIHKGPSEHVLQVYLKRCREAQKCIKTEFPIFKVEVEQLMRHFHSKQFSSSDGSNTSYQDFGASGSKNSKRFSRRLRLSSLKKKKAKADHFDECDKGCLEYLNLILSSQVEAPLRDYTMKLMSINFPVEDALIIGLAKIVFDELPPPQRDTAPDHVWKQWVLSSPLRCERH